MTNFVGGSALCFIGAIVVLGFIFLANAIRIVPEYQRLVVFRLGRSIGAKGPGIVLLFPVTGPCGESRSARAGSRSAASDFDHQR